jgi:hypoxanthine phosphoribosyltransferase
LNSGVELDEKRSSENCLWEEVESLTKSVASKIRNSSGKNKHDAILAVTNGGIIPARLMARELDINHILLIPIRNRKLYEQEMPLLFHDKKYLIIDDIYDTGYTFSNVYRVVKGFDCAFAFLMSRYKTDNNTVEGAYVGKILNHDKWIVFPWE